MKYLLKNIACAIMLFSIFNCTTEPVDTTQDLLIEEQSQQSNLDTADTNSCDGAAPQARIINNGSLDIKFAIYDADATMVGEEPHIGLNSTSSWIDIPVGEVVFVVINNQSGDKILVANVDTCMNFELVVDANNAVTYLVTNL